MESQLEQDAVSHNSENQGISGFTLKAIVDKCKSADSFKNTLTEVQNIAGGVNSADDALAALGSINALVGATLSEL